jgi:branched-chain amino acid transport system substrate-binding protein
MSLLRTIARLRYWPQALRCTVGAALLTPMLAMAQPAAATNTTPSARDIKIGLIGPFTGGSSDFGIPMRNGVMLAIDEINALGGYAGRKLDVVMADDLSTPDGARQATEAMLKQGVIAAIGFCNTGNVLKSADLFQKAQVPLIVPCAAGTPVTAIYPAKESYIFRNAARDSLQVPFVVDDAVRRGWSRIALFADTTPYGDGGVKDFLAAMEKHKLKPVYTKRFGLGVKDLTDAMREAKAAGAEAIFAITVGPENAVIAKSRDAIGWNATQIGTWPLSFPFFIDGAKSSAEGALMAQTFIAEPSNERRATFLAHYRQAYKLNRITVPVAAAQGYDAAYLLAYALFKVRDGKLTGPAIKHGLENSDRAYYGVVTTYKNPFSSEDHDAITANMLYLGMVKNGAITFAYPQDAKRNLAVQRKE